MWRAALEEFPNANHHELHLGSAFASLRLSLLSDAIHRRYSRPATREKAEDHFGDMAYRPTRRITGRSCREAVVMTCQR
jgi:hypothetical protein